MSNVIIATACITDMELEKRIAETLVSNNAVFAAMGLRPDDKVVCANTAKYIVALLNIGKTRLVTEHT